MEFFKKLGFGGVKTEASFPGGAEGQRCSRDVGCNGNMVCVGKDNPGGGHCGGEE